MKKTSFLAPILLGMVAATFGSCSNDDEGICGDWSKMILSVNEVSDNVRVDIPARVIYVTAPGGTLDLVCENYKSFDVFAEGLPPDIRDMPEGSEERWYAFTHISGEYYDIAAVDNHLYCEIHDVPEEFSGELTYFIVTPGDLFEHFRIIVEK